MPDRERIDRIHEILSRRPAVAELAGAARREGVEAHLVGGVLRDRLLGLPSRDFDAVVSGRGREVSTAVAAALGAHLVHLGGKAFAAYRVVGAGGDDWVLDVWDREGASLHSDLARRDFTVNSFALALGGDSAAADGRRWVDPFDGVGDVARRRLRATTEDSLRGDPLRVLRLPRLLVQLPGFTADPRTMALARDAAPGLAGVAAERVREELVLIFRSADAGRALGLLAALAVYPGLWRGEPGAQTAADSHRAGRAAGELERLERRAAAVHEAAPGAPALDLLAARIAATFAALAPGEPDTARDSLERFRDAGYLTRHLAQRAERLLAEPGVPDSERDRRRFLHRLGPLWPTALASLGSRESEPADRDRWRRAVGEIAALVERAGRDVLDPPRLLGGEDVQRLLGVAPGPKVGRALDRVRRAQVDGTVSTRAQAEALLRTEPGGGAPPVRPSRARGTG